MSAEVIIGQMTRNLLAVLSTRTGCNTSAVAMKAQTGDFLRKGHLCYVQQLISIPRETVLSLVRQAVIVYKCRPGFAGNVTINSSRLMKSLLLSDMPLHSYICMSAASITIYDDFNAVKKKLLFVFLSLADILLLCFPGT